MNTITHDSLAPVLLSHVESYFWRFEQDLQAFRGCVICRVEGRIQENFLKTALLTLQRRHPKLRAKIVDGDDGRLRYVFQNPRLPIPYEIQDYDGVEFPWREEARRVLERKLPVEGPLAAVVVLRSRTEAYSEILITATHAFMDGLSGVTLVDNLLAEYAKAEAGLDTSADAILPCVSVKFARPQGGWRGSFLLLKRFIRLKREESRTVLTPLPENKDVPPLSEWVHWVFTADETAQLVKRLRKERTSLNSAILTAVSFGLRDSLPCSEALFKWQLPFTVREWLQRASDPVTNEDLGCFVSNMNGYIRCNQQSSFWDVARDAQDEIQQFVNQGGPTFGYNVPSFFYNLSTNVSRLFRRPRPRLSPLEKQRVTILANNYGLLNIRDSYGSLRPTACTEIFLNKHVGPSMIIQAMVVGQRLNIGFAADSLQPDFWERLQTMVMGYIKSAMETVEAPIGGTRHMPQCAQVEISAQRIKVAAQE